MGEHYSPASAIPKKKREAIKPWKLWVRPIVVIQMPQRTMMAGMKTEGRSRLRRMLVRGSNRA